MKNKKKSKERVFLDIYWKPLYIFVCNDFYLALVFNTSNFKLIFVVGNIENIIKVTFDFKD